MKLHFPNVTGTGNFPQFFLSHIIHGIMGLQLESLQCPNENWDHRICRLFDGIFLATFRSHSNWGDRQGKQENFASKLPHLRRAVANAGSARTGHRPCPPGPKPCQCGCFQVRFWPKSYLQSSRMPFVDIPNALPNSRFTRHQYPKLLLKMDPYLLPNIQPPHSSMPKVAPGRTATGIGVKGLNPIGLCLHM